MYTASPSFGEESPPPSARPAPPKPRYPPQIAGQCKAALRRPNSTARGKPADSARPPVESMRLFVKEPASLYTVSIAVARNEATVRDVKAALEADAHLPAAEITLVYHGGRLDDARSLGSYGVVANDTLFMALCKE